MLKRYKYVFTNRFYKQVLAMTLQRLALHGGSVFVAVETLILKAVLRNILKYLILFCVVS